MFGAALLPTSLGYHDVAMLLSPHPVVRRGAGAHLIASPFGTIEPATFTYARPIGTSMPPPPGYQLANFDPDTTDAKFTLLDAPIAEPEETQIVYPSVNRDLKGDRFPAAKAKPVSAPPALLPQLQPIDAIPARQPASPAPPPPAATPRPTHAQAPDAASPVSRMDAVDPASVAAAAAAVPHAAEPAPDAADTPDDTAIPREVPAAGDVDAFVGQSPAFSALTFVDRNADNPDGQIFFDAAALGTGSRIERWSPGAEPVMVPSAETGIKLAALEPPGDESAGGETVAGKDDATRLQSPAQRLGLAGPVRAKAEKCLTDAIYFEARGEPYRGQEAVAQVVMNRVFSGYYPRNVCGVVFQNASHYLGCQFTFACEHKNLNRIDEPEMWAQAKRIAQDELDGKIWLADIGHATHYHAYWVHPSWVHEMRRLYKLGVHTFYRPRAWGNGDDEPVWGPAARTSKIEGVDGNPQAEAAAPPTGGDNAAATAKL